MTKDTKDAKEVEMVLESLVVTMKTALVVTILALVTAVVVRMVVEMMTMDFVAAGV